MKQKLIIFSLIMTIQLSLLACDKQFIQAQPPSANKLKNTVVEKQKSKETSKILAPQSSKYALYDCKIINGDGSIIKNGVLFINQDKIEKIGTADNISIPNDYEKVDLDGRTVLPGFINTHVHTGYVEANLQNWVKSGVTTVRDLGTPNIDMLESYLKSKDSYNKRSDTARLVSSSPILTVPNGYGRDFFNSPEEAKKLVNKYIKMGVDCIKFSICSNQAGKEFAMPTKEELKAIVDTAHDNGKMAIVHITQTNYLSMAAELGVDEVGHMTVGQIDPTICDTFIDKKITWIPTLELWERVKTAYKADFMKTVKSNLKRYYDKGGLIAFGTDYNGIANATFDQGFPITEVKLMKQAGMSNMDIIIAGTKNAAYACGLDKDLGTLVQGKIADILIVNGNPLKKIEDLQNTAMVIHNGNVAYKK